MIVGLIPSEAKTASFMSYDRHEHRAWSSPSTGDFFYAFRATSWLALQWDLQFMITERYSFAAQR